MLQEKQHMSHFPVGGLVAGSRDQCIKLWEVNPGTGRPNDTPLRSEVPLAVRLPCTSVHFQLCPLHQADVTFTLGRAIPV